MNYKHSKYSLNMAQTKNINIDNTGKKILLAADMKDFNDESSEGPEDTGDT